MLDPRVLHRSRRRRHEDGAAMFIVAMTLAVLGSLGMYALVAASNEVRTSGNERQSTQTHYLAQYGILGAAHEMVASRAQFYLGLMMSAPDSPCISLPSVPSTAPPILRACRRLGSPELGQAWAGAITLPYGGTSAGGTQPAAFTQGQTPGSFGPVPMNGDFFVELTEPTQVQAAARYATNLNFCFIQMTATSTGFTQPALVGQPTAVYANMGIEQERARLVAGPIQCPR